MVFVHVFSPGPGGGSERVAGMEGEAAFVADRVIAVSERLKVELCETYQLPEVSRGPQTKGG